MDFDEAIATHRNWRFRLLNLIAGTQARSFDPRSLRLDRACPLGQWLAGEGRAFDRFPEYGALLQEHRAFHQCADGVVQLVDQGWKGEATLVVKTGEFHAASVRTINAILHLRQRLSNATAPPDHLTPLRVLPLEAS